MTTKDLSTLPIVSYWAVLRGGFNPTPRELKFRRDGDRLVYDPTLRNEAGLLFGCNYLELDDVERYGLHPTRKRALEAAIERTRQNIRQVARSARQGRKYLANLEAELAKEENQ